METRILSVFFGVVIATQCFADPFPDNTESVRPLGMGGAFTAVANDANSVWTNPAGIAKIRKNRDIHRYHLITIPNLVVGGNQAGLAFADAIYTSSASKTSTKVSQAADRNKGSDQSLLAFAGFNPVVFFEPSRGIPMEAGLYFHNRLSVKIPGDSTKKSEISSVQDVGTQFGYAYQSLTNRFNAGIQTRVFSRSDYSDTVDTEMLGDQKKLESRIQQDGNKGTGVAVDLGWMWTLADFWLPTIGMAMLNAPTGCREDYYNPYAEKRQQVCGTKITGSVVNPESPALLDPTDLRVGVSITPRLTHSTSLRFAFDLQHLYFTDGTHYYGLSGIDAQKQVHAGMEFLWGNPMLRNAFSLRVGYNGGFLTSGCSVRVASTIVELATYGTDVSPTPTPKEDRRTALSLSVEF